MTDYYATLGIEKDATNAEIKIAYRKLSIKFHPDKNDGDAFFEKMFLRIQEAYETLSDPVKKNAYDTQLSNLEYSNANQQNNFQPVIEFFESSADSFHNGDNVTFKWKVYNADNIELKPFGNVSAMGEKSYNINNVRLYYHAIELNAINSHIGLFAQKRIILINKSYTIFENKTNKQGEKTSCGYWSSKGRIGRATFFKRIFSIFALIILLSIFHKNNFGAVMLFITFIIGYIGLTIQSIKRLHDLNMSGWWSIANFLPYFNILFLILISLLPGNANDNKYGAKNKI